MYTTFLEFLSHKLYQFYCCFLFLAFCMDRLILSPCKKELCASLGLYCVPWMNIWLTLLKSNLGHAKCRVRLVSVPSLSQSFWHYVRVSVFVWDPLSLRHCYLIDLGNAYVLLCACLSDHVYLYVSPCASMSSTTSYPSPRLKTSIFEDSKKWVRHTNGTDWWTRPSFGDVRVHLKVIWVVVMAKKLWGLCFFTFKCCAS